MQTQSQSSEEQSEYGKRKNKNRKPNLGTAEFSEAGLFGGFGCRSSPRTFPHSSISKPYWQKTSRLGAAADESELTADELVAREKNEPRLSEF